MRLFTIEFKEAAETIGVPAGTQIILGSINPCSVPNGAREEGTHPQLDIQYYKKFTRQHIVDVTTIQCVIGRVKELDSYHKRWAVIDRSGDLNRAIYAGEPIEP